MWGAVHAVKGVRRRVSAVAGWLTGGMAQAPVPVTATRALVLAHDPEAPAGWLGEGARARGVALVTVDATLGDLPRASGSADVVVVLGSFRSAYATEPAWIVEEA